MGPQIPARDEVLAMSNRHLPADIRSELADSPQYGGMGIGGLLYGWSGGLRDPRELHDAYRVGGLWGVAVLRADDLVDGDHSYPRVDDTAGFLDNCVTAAGTGRTPEPLEYGLELSVYEPFTMLHDAVADAEHGTDELTMQLRDLRDLVLAEDASNDYAEKSAVAGTTGEVLGTLLDATTSYTADTDNQAVCFDLGVLGQTCDDLFDGDEPVTDDRISDEAAAYREQVQERRPAIGTVMRAATTGYTGIAAVARKGASLAGDGR